MITLSDFFLFLFVLSIVFTIYWYLTIPKNLPPGPAGLPFLGSCLQYFDGQRQNVVLQEHVQKYGPLSSLYIGNKLVIILGNYDMIYEAMVKQGDAFTGRPKMGESFVQERIRGLGLSMSEGDLWKEQRRFALSTLRDFGVGRPLLESRIKEEVEYLCERISEYTINGQEFDPQRLITCAVSNIINQLMFGHRFSYDDEEFVRHFMSLSKRSSAVGVGFLSPFVIIPQTAVLMQFLPALQESNKEIRDFEDYVEREVQKTVSTFESEVEPSNYIHAFLKAGSGIQGESYFTYNQLFASCRELFQAGTETSAATTRWAILFLSHHPEIQEKLYKEIKHEVGSSALPNYADRVKLPYAEAVIMETQRLANLLPTGFYRRSTVPTKIMGYDIPEDAIVLSFLTNIFHNPDVYPEPFKFDPDRFMDSSGKVIRDPKLIPFQLGKRICLGEPLARMEIFLILVGLTSRFRFYFPIGKPKPTMEPVIGFFCTPVPHDVCVENRD